jgi:hypothetical protein
VRAGVLLMGGALVAVSVSPTVLWALLPLLLAGAAAVHAESAATGVVQHEADDDVRASLFGLADACMVGAAMLGALVAPVLAGAVGPAVMLGTLAVVAVATTAVTVRRVEPVAQVAQLRPTTTVPPMSSSVSTSTTSPADAKSSVVRSA